MTLLFVGVLQKLGRDGLRVDSGCHVVVPFVPQHANDFSRQCLVQNLDGGPQIDFVAFGNRTLFDVLARALTQSFDISQKWFIGHVCDSFDLKIISSKGREDVTRRMTDEQVGELR